MGNDTEAAELPAVAEERRQRAVESLGLDEHHSNERFDRITRLARTVFGVDWTSITVLDRNRAWFPSAQGFAIAEMPRTDTFCDRTTEADDLLVVRDASLDPRFADLPAVRNSGIRFYAGVPLRDRAGHAIGVFCLYDRNSRTLDGEELQTLRDMAAWAEQELVSSNEMSQASVVQASLLPADAIRAEGWDIHGVCLPASAVGGDFYDYGLNDGVVHLGLGDVMGKGTGAALVGAGVRAAIRNTHAAVTAGVDLGITTTQVARSVGPDLERAQSFVTLFEAAIDLDDGFVRYVDAGMGLAVLVRGDGAVVRLASDDRPFGILPEDHWTEHDFTIEPGDRLLVFSDGLLELMGDPLEWWDPIGALVLRHPDVGSLLAEVVRLTADRVPLDDVTALAVFRSPDGPGA